MMCFQVLADFAVPLLGASQDIKGGAHWIASGGKMFFVGGPHPDQWTHCSDKAYDQRFLELTGLPGFESAPHATRYHWLAVLDAMALPWSELEALAKRLHALVAGKSPKKRRLSLAVEA